MLRMTARSMTAARVDSSMSVPRNIACAAFSALCRNSHALTCARTCTCAFRTRTCTCSRRGLSTSSGTGTGTGTGSVAKQRVLSGIQPTGKLHIGNYAGALKQWVDNQHKYDNYFCVVDMHAITNLHDKTRLRRETLASAAMYIAAGIDPKESCIFIQSHVPAHAELTWLLNCITPVSWLERMIQFKEKSSKHGGNDDAVSVGLFDYPVLMAADILLYQAQLVPVGEDQRQHLELARDICRRFNDRYPHSILGDNIESTKKNKKNKAKKNFVFREPEALVLQEGARLMSLLDGTSKMSKSHEADGSRINLLDSPDEIVKKIKRCKTDNIAEDMIFCNPDRPECSNMLNIYQTMTGKSQEVIEREVAGMQWGQFKPLLAEAIVEHLSPLQREYQLIMQDEIYIEDVLKEGRLKAAATADHTLLQAKQALGFYVPT